MHAYRARFLAATVLAILSAPMLASAQGTSVHVLGLRSVEGDDDFARELSSAIRVASGAIPGWAVSPDEVSLSQMTMVYGCDDPNTTCMTSIADELGADKVIYGTVRRAGSGDDFAFGLSLYLFDRASASIAEQLSDTIPQTEADMEALRPRAVRYASQFSGQVSYGAIRLEVGEAGATVQVDGETIGTTTAAGTILVEDLTEGTHEVRIDAVGYDSFETEVDVVADEQAELRVNLSAPGTSGDGPNLRWVPGAALIAGGIVAVAFGIRSGVRVNQWNSEVDDIDQSNLDALQLCANNRRANGENDFGKNETVDCPAAGATLTRAQGLVLLTNRGSNACSNAPQGWRRDTCDEHQRNTRVQYAMYVLGAAAIGAGSYLLIRALTGDDDDEESSNNVDVSPWASVRSGGVDMRVDW